MDGKDAKVGSQATALTKRVHCFKPGAFVVISKDPTATAVSIGRIDHSVVHQHLRFARSQPVFCSQCRPFTSAKWTGEQRRRILMALPELRGEDKCMHNQQGDVIV